MKANLHPNTISDLKVTEVPKLSSAGGWLFALQFSQTARTNGKVILNVFNVI